MAISYIICEFYNRMYSAGFSNVSLKFSRFHPFTGERMYLVKFRRGQACFEKELSLSDLKSVPRFF